MYRIFWSRRALIGYAAILNYLDENWTQKEIGKFEKELAEFLSLLSQNPKVLQSIKGEIRRGPINKLTILTYQVDFNKEEIYLLNIRSARQKPIQ